MTDEFPLDPEVLHLNHAGVAPWPRRTVAAVTRFAEENARLGSRRYPAWLATERRLRERLARLIGAAPHDIALVKSTSEALSIIAHGLRWQPGENVVGILQEFPSNRIVWESLAPRGVGLRQLDLARSEAPEDDLLALCDAHTRLVAVSSVQYARGRRLDLERLGAGCRLRGIHLCVDAIQSLGALPFDLGRCTADFVVADGHKWLLGPEGVALLYVAPALREALDLHQFGWHMVAERGDFERPDWRAAPDATRFECGSPNMLGIHALEASLSLLEEIGIERVADAIGERTARLIALVDRHGFELLSPRAAARRAGIVTFRVPGADQPALYEALMGHGVLCAARGGGVRFSPHFYTREETLVRAMELAAALAGGQVRRRAQDNPAR
ncbi:aminotransferase class V-fold PLP-dependent enzyme [Thiococcus pfennigii]|uniref:aminotransferase class V-fold PLP-dependent enzyme n=1 Tax=Thiococcus pfennigii TaxID=1057 RepID=UPI001902E355|nr:aminotransferase class V-fold PLP-dependent enzyme [Thiococcus pfennigii]MBK1699459.1 aminotransferase [Thiococcus pfennigii]